MLDYMPLRYVAALFGLGGINFITVFAGTLVYLLWIQHDRYRIQRAAYWNLGVCISLFIATGFLVQSGWLYQRSYYHNLSSSVPVSCLLSQAAAPGSAQWTTIWNVTTHRAQAGDRIILWSEEALSLRSSTSERNAILQASAIAKAASNNGAKNHPYIGITYELTLDGGNSYTNRFVLIKPDGSMAWSYDKAYPVPVVESNVRPGKVDLPTYSAPGLGKLGGAICFDLDHPWFIRQAGERRVDILLQPSWTWGAVGPRHFDNNALRAGENGYTLFRCSSDGVSGVVAGAGSWGGQIPSQVVTGHNTDTPILFQLPINLPVEQTIQGERRFITLYTLCGFVFDWIMLGFSIIVAFTVLFNMHYLVESFPFLSFILYFLNEEELPADYGKKYDEVNEDDNEEWIQPQEEQGEHEEGKSEHSLDMQPRSARDEKHTNLESDGADTKPSDGDELA